MIANNKFTEDFQLEDSEEYRQSQTNSYRDIVLAQFRRCCDSGSQEMTEGGVSTRFIDGQVVTITLQNQKEIFINSVDMLKTMLNSHIQSKEHISKKIEEIKEKYTIDGLKELDEAIKQKKNTLGKNLKDTRRIKHQTDYNLLINQRKKMFEGSKFEKSKLILLVLEQLLSELNYLDEAGGSA